MTMCVLVPSRGRPSNIARLAEAWFTTGATAHLVVCIDSDDPELEGYIGVWQNFNRGLGNPAYDHWMPSPDDPFDLKIGEPSRIGPILNKWAPVYAERFDVVGFMGDDHLPRTEGWDTRLGAAAGEWGVAYGNDLLQGANLATAAFIGSGTVRALGKFVPDGLKHLYLDNFWMTLGRALGSLTYLDDVVIEHLHYLVGKAVEDDLYREVNDSSMYAHDGARWAEYATSGEFDADLARVIAARDAS